jgi:hypothetical protein
VAGVHLFAQAQHSIALQLVHIARHRPAVASQLLRQRGDAKAVFTT